MIDDTIFLSTLSQNLGEIIILYTQFRTIELDWKKLYINKENFKVK